MQQSQALGARQIELHTGEYCHSTGAATQSQLQRLAAAARLAAELEMEVAAGHGLNLTNLENVVAIAQIEELNIGHAIMADALRLGIAGAVQAYRGCVARGVAARRVPPNERT